MDFFMEAFCLFKFYIYHYPIAESLPGKHLANITTDIKKILFNFIQYIKFLGTFLRNNSLSTPPPISFDTGII